MWIISIKRIKPLSNQRIRGIRNHFQIKSNKSFDKNHGYWPGKKCCLLKLGNQKKVKLIQWNRWGNNNSRSWQVSTTHIAKTEAHGIYQVLRNLDFESEYMISMMWIGG